MGMILCSLERILHSKDYVNQINEENLRAKGALKEEVLGNDVLKEVNS